MDAQQHEDHILIFHVMERRNCALIMLKRVGGSQDIIRIPNKQLERIISYMNKANVVFHH